MESFSSFFLTKKFPSRSALRTILRAPLTALGVTVYGIFFALCAAIFITIVVFNNRFLVTVPARGGTLTEGVIGAPHFINPVLATTSTDKRLVALVYGSLLKLEPDNTLSPMLAKEYAVSPDGTVFTITMLPNLRFDDGKPLTSADVAFTVQKLQNSTISRDAEYWQHIAVEAPDEATVVFTLPAPDTTFMSHLTFGILPEHIWKDIADESFATAKQNFKAVGAGPFKVSSVAYTNDVPDAVVLKRNTKYYAKPAMLKSVVLKSYANQNDLVDALNDKDVDFSYSVSPDGLAGAKLEQRLLVASIPTTQAVSIYRSSKDSVLANPGTVLQLSQLIDKNAIIATVQHGYGTPYGASANTIASNSTSATTTRKLSIGGFSLAVEDDPSLLLAAQSIAQQLQQQGITVSIRAYDPGVFQHYVSNGTFSLFLARSSDNMILSNYAAAIPLYTESLPYVFTTSTHTIIPDTLRTPLMEYSSVTDWYAHTDKLWKWLIAEDNN
ncbi:MAG: ABC transporter substrate-binding protein [Patescibacteria group bacterium]